MNFSERLLLYKQRQKTARSLIFDDVELPKGNTVRDILEKLMETRRIGSLPEHLPSTPQKYIAICIVIVDRLLHEEIWKKWISSNNTESCSFVAEIFVHAKYPEKIESDWVRDRLIDKSFSPEWNSPEVVRAMLQLLNFSLQTSTEKVFERFIFCTESCIPIRSLSECGNLLFSSEKSWVPAYNIPESSWEDAHCFRAVNRDVIPPKSVTKAIPGWIMLVRRHAEEIIALLKRFGGWDPRDFESQSANHFDIISAFGPPGQWSETSGGVFAPEEVFFPTMLSILGYIQSDNPRKEEIERRAVVFASWKRKGDANPIKFSSLDETLLTRIRESGALIGRKFPADSINVEEWTVLVLNSKSDQSPHVSNDFEEKQTNKRQKIV